MQLSANGAAGYHAGGDGGVIFINGTIKLQDESKIDIHMHFSVIGGESKKLKGRVGYVWSKYRCRV